jgi:hypothetical protein
MTRERANCADARFDLDFQCFCDSRNDAHFVRALLRSTRLAERK